MKPPPIKHSAAPPPIGNDNRTLATITGITIVVVVLLILFLMLRKPSSGGSNTGMESVAESGGGLDERKGSDENGRKNDDSGKPTLASQSVGNKPSKSSKAMEDLASNDKAESSKPTNEDLGKGNAATTGGQAKSANENLSNAGQQTSEGDGLKSSDPRDKAGLKTSNNADQSIVGKQEGNDQSRQIGISGITSRPVKFFGVEADAGTVVFVIDKSSSMSGDQRLNKAIAELKRSINSLDSSQKFGIVFFDSLAYPQTSRNVSASTRNKRIELQKLNSIYPSGGTNPTPAIEWALGTNADALFLLSDGEVHPSSVTKIKSLNTKHLPIHTVSFSPNVVHLKQIALDSKGFFRVAR